MIDFYFSSTFLIFCSPQFAAQQNRQLSFATSLPLIVTGLKFLAKLVTGKTYFLPNSPKAG
jgi:hypothetical protein